MNYTQAPGGDPALTRRFFLAVALGLLIFVVYGSLVPLDFRPKSPEVAWRQFLSMPYLDLGIGSRADWVANLLLYIPLAFCLTAALDRPSGRRPGPVAYGAVFLFCVSVALAIEFAQLFFPPRTVSRNDILAEAIGTVLGIALARLGRRRLVGLFQSVARGGPSAVRAAAIVYALGYLALSLFPYDFVISAADLEWKIRNGMYGLIFVPKACGRILACGVQIMAEVAAAIPLGVLVGMLVSRGRTGRYRAAFAGGIALGAVIEFAQFFIASGYSQGVSLLTRGAGFAIGVFAGDILRAVGFERLRRTFKPLVLLSLLPYLLLLMSVNGWFSAGWLDPARAFERLGEVRFLPFYYHYWSTEPVALRSLLLHAGAYLPIGIAWWMWTAHGSWPKRGSAWIAVAIAAALAVVMEAGKLFVPGKKPDPTDALIAACAAYGAWVVASALRRWSSGTSHAPSRSVQSQRVETGVPFNAARAASLPVFLAAAIFLFLYPYNLGLGAFLCVYAALLWRWPPMAIPAVLALLPVLDLAPWTGWFFFDEFDIVMLVTVGILLWRIPASQWSLHKAGVYGWLVGLLTISYVVSGLIGLLPLQPLDANAFSSYFSHYNSLRALKGYAWALLLAAPAIHQARSALGQQQLVGGMMAGLAGVALVALWERHLFAPSLLDFSTDYRITSMFSGMHIGGAFVDGYIVFALPFIFLWMRLRNSLGAHILGACIFVLASYALMVTFSRGAYLGYVVGLVLFGIAAFAGTSRGRSIVLRLVFLGALAAAIALVVALPMLEGTYMKGRWAATSKDAGIRLSHWGDVIALMNDSAATMMFGMGLGRFPASYYFGNPSNRPLASYRYETEGKNSYLALGGGEDLYFGQRLPAQGEAAYVLVFDVRGPTAGLNLGVALCEKSVLYSQNCHWIRLKGKTAKAWERQQVVFKPRTSESAAWHAARPMQLSFSNATSGTVVHIDNVRLLDAAGRNLVRNGDFSAGNNHWFFSSDNHLRWHTMNLALQILFEQGLFGLLAFLAAGTIAVMELSRAAVRNEPLAATLLSAFAGFLLVGLIDGLFDSPRLSQLFFLWLFVAIAASRGSGASGQSPRRFSRESTKAA